MICIIEEDEVRALIDRREAIGLIAHTYQAAAAGKADVSLPAAMSLRGASGSGTSFKVKGALLEEANVAGFRCIGNAEEGNSSYVFLFDAKRAAAQALVSEAWLHRLRTAATGLVTCRALAPKDAKSIALIGSGRIAEEFVRIVHFAFQGLPIALASRSAERARQAAENWRPLTPNPLRPAASIPEAVSGADIVVTLSDAKEQLFCAKDLKKRALLCAMGGRHEFDSDVLKAASHFVVDEIDFVCTAGNAAHWIKSGQITRAALEQRVDATIGEVLAGHKEIKSDGLVLAIIQGMAICDVALAHLAFNRHSEKRD